MTAKTNTANAPVLVRNGLTAYEAAVVCVDAGTNAYLGLHSGLWAGDPNWSHGVHWIDDVQSRINYVLARRAIARRAA